MSSEAIVLELTGATWKRSMNFSIMPKSLYRTTIHACWSVMYMLAFSTTHFRWFCSCIKHSVLQLVGNAFVHSTVEETLATPMLSQITYQEKSMLFSLDVNWSTEHFLPPYLILASRAPHTQTSPWSPLKNDSSYTDYLLGWRGCLPRRHK